KGDKNDTRELCSIWFATVSELYFGAFFQRTTTTLTMIQHVCRQAPCFKSKFITAELARLFSQSDSEEDFEGFSEDEEEEDRRSFYTRRNFSMLFIVLASYPRAQMIDVVILILILSLRFPVKRLSTHKRELKEKNAKKPVKETPPSQRARGRQRMKPQQQDEEEEEEEDEEEEVLSQSLRKRDKNIQENKAMVMNQQPLGVFSTFSLSHVLHSSLLLPFSWPTLPRKRKLEPEMGSERRNPSRKARPPENFGVEKSEPLAIRNPRMVDIRRLVEVGGKRRRRSRGSRRSHYAVRSVDDITQEDLDNIAHRSKDKIWDKDTGSSCHQCRQKTLDTKTVCRSGFCVGGKGQFCGPCLKNRYGEEVRDVLLDPTWSCPICRDMCNCSLCRKKEGRCATGILVGLARYNGHGNVHEYLESIQRDLL
uniref:Zinc-finger domain-containing protein n=1 Tax=Gasterosteus aculeatus aculeatus TaxID=481459 RepID=A0AAQ4RJ32_GASAC